MHRRLRVLLLTGRELLWLRGLAWIELLLRMLLGSSLLLLLLHVHLRLLLCLLSGGSARVVWRLLRWRRVVWLLLRR